MKKAIALLLATFLFISVLSFNVFAEDTVYDLTIEAPDYYLAGETIKVKVTVDNITVTDGLHVIKFKFSYDSSKFVLKNDIDEENYNILKCLEVIPEKWEELSKVNNTWNADLPEGTEVLPINDGNIWVSAGTDSISESNAIKENDKLVFAFDFIAKDDASGNADFSIDVSTIEGGYHVDKGVTIYSGNCSESTVTVIDEVEHDYDSVVTPPSCDTNGYTTHTCKNCGDTYTDSETPAQHTAGPEADCENDQVCTVCGEVLDTAKGHTEGEWVTLEDGSKELRCTVCDYVLDTKTTPATHEPATDDWKSDENNHWKECGCGLHLNEGSHDEGHWIIVTRPGLDQEGLNELRCTVCGFVLDTEKLPAAIRNWFPLPMYVDSADHV